MHILFIEDMPEYKVVHLIDFLKYKKIDFTYEICKSVNSALRYCMLNKDRVDLIILDLGLPRFDDSNTFNLDYDEHAGFDIIEEICYRKKIRNIPIIINSETEIKPTDDDIDEKKWFELNFGPDVIIEHEKRLTGEILLEFINKHLKDKI